MIIKTEPDLVSERILRKKLFLITGSLMLVACASFVPLLIDYERFIFLASIFMMSFFSAFFPGSMLLMSYFRKGIVPSRGQYEIRNDRIVFQHFKIGTYEIPFNKIREIVPLGEGFNASFFNMFLSSGSDLKVPAEGFLNPYLIKTEEPIVPVRSDPNWNLQGSFRSFRMGDDHERTAFRYLWARVSK